MSAAQEQDPDRDCDFVIRAGFINTMAMAEEDRLYRLKMRCEENTEATRSTTDSAVHRFANIRFEAEEEALQACSSSFHY